MSFTVKGFLGKVKSKEWKGRPFAAFGTENPENIEKGEGSAAVKIAGVLEEKEMKQAMPPLRGVVFGMKGPLQEGEIERVKEYAAELAGKLKSSTF